jgi:hypothetical protein
VPFSSLPASLFSQRALEEFAPVSSFVEVEQEEYCGPATCRLPLWTEERSIIWKGDEDDGPRAGGTTRQRDIDVAYFWKRKRVCMTLLSAALARTRIKYE